MVERRPEHRIVARSVGGGEIVLISYGLYKEKERSQFDKGPSEMRRLPLAEVETEDGRAVSVIDETEGVFEINGVQFTQASREVIDVI